MKSEKLLRAMGNINDELVVNADKRRSYWKQWAISAACLVFVFLGALALARGEEDAAVVSTDTMDGAPMVTVGGTDYIVSTRSITEELQPEGFEYSGVIADGEFAGCEYYTSEAVPYWVYVKTVSTSTGETDQYGNLITTEPRVAFVRFVDEAVRGNHYVSVDGQLYVSSWHTVNGRDNIFGDLRLEGVAPEGFVSIGNAEFSGYDTVPDGALSSNSGEEEVFVNENDDSVILVSTVWHTAPDASGEKRHEGFNVYLKVE